MFFLERWPPKFPWLAHPPEMTDIFRTHGRVQFNALMGEEISPALPLERPFLAPVLRGAFAAERPSNLYHSC